MLAVAEWTLVLLLSLVPTLLGQDPFVTGKGYSFLWLSALYVFGSGERLWPPERTRRAGFWFGGYALCVLAVFFSRLAIETVTQARTGAPAGGGWLLTYFLEDVGAEEAKALRDRVARELKTTFASKYTQRITLEQALDPAVIAAYGKRATGEKYLITPQR